ncbi:MAG TPA: amidohydrolase family protein [Polyangiaceae bacterium]
MSFDVIIKNGLCFDGTGAPGERVNLGIRDGRVAVKCAEPLDEKGCGEVVDAQGQWVMPGFVDLHTHYDGEIIAAPALSESVRHGVTTVAIGSCSISAVLADAEDCSDLFTRVESVPRSHVLPLLRSKKTWSTPREYVEFLRAHPIGPNVAAFLGHSDLRARVLGLGRAVDASVRPEEHELSEMERWLEAALDAGFLGLSSMTNPWDKLDGDRFRSALLPSAYARWSEYGRLHDVLRRRGRILQSAPNITTKINALFFMLASASFFFRRTLKTTLITLADAKSTPGLHRVIALLARFVNRLFGGDFRWQTLPVPFEVYADGVDLVVFEELGSGQALLHLVSEVERNTLMKDAAYRRRFRKDCERKGTSRVWHRDFHDAFVVACPDERLVGRSFGDIAAARGEHPVDTFLDLVVLHGPKLRWRTVIANHRPREVRRMMNEEAALIGFSDAGAHIRNMAFYSFPLRMLRHVRDEPSAMPIEKAIWRLTGELSDWLGIDAGHLRVGDRADVVVVSPAALDARLDAYHEAPMEGFDGLVRMVNRSEGAASIVLVGGRVAARDGVVEIALGREGFGQFLPAGEKVAARARAQGSNAKAA